MARDGYTVVSTHLRGEEAEMLRGLLESSGIDGLVEDAALSSLNPLLQSVIGGAKVLVPDGDAERARDLIASSGLFPGPGAGGVEIPEEEWAAGGVAAPEERAVEPSPLRGRDRDAEARRALGASLAAIPFFWTLVVPAYALVAAVRCLRAPGPASPRARRHGALALAVSTIALAFAIAAWIGRIRG